MKTKIEEKIIEEKLQHFFCGKGWSNVESQVSFTRKRIDLVIRSEIHDEIWAIEIKVKDWKTALRQANLNSVACNLSYVAIWYEYANAALKNRSRFEELGIGLMIVDENYMPKIKVYPTEQNVNINAYESLKHII